MTGADSVRPRAPTDVNGSHRRTSARAAPEARNRSAVYTMRFPDRPAPALRETAP